MKKTILKILSYVLVAVIASGTSTIYFMSSQAAGMSKLEELNLLLNQCYIGEVDQSELEDAAAAGMVSALGDEWSYYMSSDEYLAYQDTMANSYVGIGVTVRAREDNQGIDIIEVIEGSPAREAGMQVGDRLVGVNGDSVIGIDLNDVATLLRGEEGTSVKVTVYRGEETLDFTLVRRRFETVVASGKMLEGNIGLIKIKNFENRAAEETIAAIEDLIEQGAEAIIFDVRNNPGGYKHELVKLLDYLLPEGEIFRAVDYTGKEEVDYSDASCLDIPMAVLVNLQSYSAAEFFAAALDYYDAAVIVGEKTYGKGYFQTSFQLRDGSAVNLSIGKYFTPDGKSLAGVGLTPDLEIPMDEEMLKSLLMGTLDASEDPHMQAAINALKK